VDSSLHSREQQGYRLPRCDLVCVANEVLDKILTRLCLHDIGSVRLACRALALKAVQPHLKQYYHGKAVSVQKPMLEVSVAVMQSDWLGCTVHYLTITGEVESPRVTAAQDSCSVQERTATTGESSSLLTAALTNIANSRGSRVLRSVRLLCSNERRTVTKTGYREGKLAIWNPIWRYAATSLYGARLPAGKPYGYIELGYLQQF
jgi:hypothetical protein